ncbi:MAG: hypothetical protein H0W83_01330 [Planctomycetes bacterium]|nr:hypothetical protein [Planctomycetota bacterium]
MTTVTLDATTLGIVLSELARPKIESIECFVRDQLIVRLKGVTLPFLSAERSAKLVIDVLVSGKATDHRTIVISWEIGEVVGAPGMLVRTVAGMGAVQRMLRGLCDRTRFAAAIDVANHSLTVHLDLVKIRTKGLLPLVRIRELAIPGKRGQALSAQWDLELPSSRVKVRRTRARPKT